MDCFAARHRPGTHAGRVQEMGLNRLFLRQSGLPGSVHTASQLGSPHMAIKCSKGTSFTVDLSPVYQVRIISELSSSYARSPKVLDLVNRRAMADLASDASVKQ